MIITFCTFDFPLVCVPPLLCFVMQSSNYPMDTASLVLLQRKNNQTLLHVVLAQLFPAKGSVKFSS